MTSTLPLKPLPLSKTLIYVGWPTVLSYLVIWQLMPRLDRAGASPTVQFLVFGLPLAMLLVAALVVYRIEGRDWTWTAFSARMRLHATAKTWLWALALTVAGFILYLGASSVVMTMLPKLPFPMVVAKLLGDGKLFLGQPLHGNWGALGVWFAMYFVNVVGEELWWRGIVLPRQELAFGRYAWAVHGMGWAIFHGGFFPADVLVILPGALAYGWVCQRCKSTVPGLLAHAVLNGMPGLHFLLAILG